MYKGYLIDLDGTMFNGDERIEGAADFIHRLNNSNTPYMFVTNSGARTPKETLEKFNAHGIKTYVENIYTAALAAVDYLKENTNGKVFAIGSESFIETLKDNDITVQEDDVDAVLFSYDTNINYEKYVAAVRNVNNGAELILTNPDKVIRHKDDFIPGNGSLAAVVVNATGVTPKVVGKPNSYILQKALEKMGVSKENVAMVGDNYDTDIMTGIQGGIDTIHVNTGVHRTEDVEEKEIPPTHTVENLAEWEI